MPRSAAPPPARPRTLVASRLRAAVVALAAGLLLTLLAAPAYAHDELKSSNPTDQQALVTPPSSVVLTFEEPPVALGAQVVVTGPNGPVSAGSPRIDGAVVTQDLQPGAPAGRYTVEWRVTSDDGHPVSGSFAFTAQTAAGGTPTAAPASPTAAPADAARREPLIPSWGWIIAGVLVIAAGIRLNRRAKAATKQEE